MDPLGSDAEVEAGNDNGEDMEVEAGDDRRENVRLLDLSPPV